MRTMLDICSQMLRTLWAHKLRSFLTMFGIAWGVGSLLLLVGVGEGFPTGNRKQLETFGKNIIFCFGGRAPAVEGSFASMKWFNLTYDDYLAIKNESRLAINIAPMIARDDIRAVSDYTSTNGQVSGVVPVYNHVRTIPLEVGRWFNDEDNERPTYDPLLTVLDHIGAKVSRFERRPEKSRTGGSAMSASGRPRSMGEIGAVYTK